MSEALPAAEQARGWVGAELTEVDGHVVGRVHGFFADIEDREPTWLIANMGGGRGGFFRRRADRLVAVPLRECAGAPFGVWVAQEAAALRGAPIVDPERPLRREHEIAISAHFGAGEAVGRAAEVAGRKEGSVTAIPLPA